jgi:transcriptional regulator with XRE-family HTH domain
MKQKDQYTFEELCTDLTISVSEFCRRAGVTEGTLARLRQGFSARRVTANKLLNAFSQFYGLELSFDNVTGLKLEDKKAIRRQIVEHQGLTEKAETPPVSPAPVPTPRAVTDQAQKRAYKSRDTGLPDGCILALDFARNHDVKRETFRDHMMIGLGEGLIHGPDIPEDTPVGIKDWVRYEERNKRVRKDGTIERERYLTADQQHAALAFWKRHAVAYSQCHDLGCWCHTVKKGNE